MIAVSGEYIADNAPPGLLMDVLFQKGGYTQEELFATIRRLVSEG